MKKFIDKNGIFQINVPITWGYSIIDEKVHTFQEYQAREFDTFQISSRKIKIENGKNNFFNSIKSLTVSKISGIKYYSFPDVDNENVVTKTWLRLFDKKLVIFSLTYPNNLDSETVRKKIQNAHLIISSFVLIDESRSMGEVNFYRLDMFLKGMGATAILLNKAVENKAFIEATCIIANQIDALLRMGIVLKKQIINRDNRIEEEWIYQGLDDEKKSEKDIYEKALELKIINQNIFDELYKLYEDRNRVVHRFIISEITLAEVEEIARRYYIKQGVINKIIYNIESEQIRLGVGMTIDGKDKTKKFDYSKYIRGKIGKLDYFKDLKKKKS